MKTVAMLLAGSVFSLAMSGTAVAEEVDAASSISAVMIFPRSAEVTRTTAALQVPAGDHVIVLRDLPAQLRGDSIRVEGTSTDTLVIGPVDALPMILPETEAVTQQRKDLEDQLQVLTDAQAELRDAISGAEAQKSLIRNLAVLPQQPAPRGEAIGARSPSDWAALSGTIGAQMAEITKGIRAANVSQRENQEKILFLQRKLATLAPRRVQRKEVRVSVTSAAAMQANLTVKYQVPGASWQPIYEARLNTGDAEEKPALALVRRARVSQSTGEDWTNVALTLSTTNPGQGTAAPKVETLRAEFQPDRRTYKQRKTSNELSESTITSTAPEADADAGAGFAQPAAPRLRRAKKRLATVTNTAFQANYAIPGAQTIPTNRAVRLVNVDQITMPAKLTIRTVPRKRAIAYLYADVKIGDGVRLLPGSVSLFRDGVFVGRGGLPTLTAGEDHELGFGQDDTVRVSHVVVKEQTGESGIISTTRTDTRQYRTTVTNGHKRAVDVRLLDQLPVAADSDIEVVLTSGITPPTVRDLKDKPGVFAWDFRLKPQGEKVIDFGYRLSWPDGKNVRIREVRQFRKKAR